MRRRLTKVTIRAASAFLAAIAMVPAVPVAAQDVPWRLLWSDEFLGPEGSPPDPAKWTYDLGNGSNSNPGWGNSEIQRYSNSTKNVFLDGRGHLVIRVLREKSGYSSGRIKTQPRFAFLYGRVDARIKIPYAKAVWPAFWLLGANCGVTPWPQCGEIDIMENFGVQGQDHSRTRAALHGPGFSGTGVAGIYQLHGGESIAERFHCYSIEWSSDRLDFFVDGLRYLSVTPASLPTGSQWVFNGNPFYAILNVAVGGIPVGYPDRSTSAPQEMIVDYVRVFQR